MKTPAATRSDLILSPDGHQRNLAIYGAAHFGKSLFWYASETISAYYLTDAVGLSGAAMGWVIALGLLVAAMLDPLVDRVFSARLATAHGAARLQLIGACLSAITLTAMFTGNHIAESARLGFVITTALAFRLAYALYDQPQNAMISLATRSAEDRTTVSAYRLVLSGLGALVIAAIAATLASRDSQGGTSADARYFVTALLLSICAVASAAMLDRIRGTTPSLPIRVPSSGPRWTSLPSASGMPLGLAFIIALTVPIFSKAQPYLVGRATSSVLWGTLIGGAVPVGAILAQPLWRALAKRCSRRYVTTVAAAILAAAGLSFWVAALASPATAVIAAFFVGVGNGGIAITVWAAFGDSVARPAGQPGWNFGLLTASIKIGLAAGIVGFGLLLDHTDPAVPKGEPLVTVMAIGPIMGGLGCLTLLLYPMTRSRLLRTSAEVAVHGFAGRDRRLNREGA